MTQKNIMILVASGFDQASFLTLQRTLAGVSVKATVVSSEKSLVNAMDGASLGLTFPVDQAIDETLASDFDGIVIIGGEKSITRLTESAHTNRIIEACIDADLPVVALDEAQRLVPESVTQGVHLSAADENLAGLVLENLGLGVDAVKQAA